EGSGLVHIAPSFGEEDFKLMGIKEGLPITIDDKARMGKGLPGAGKYIKEADKDIVADLTKRGLLYHAGVIEHEYPFCWRCSNPLIYMVRESWFIEMSRLREKIVKNNAQINWIPGHIKDGRFGEWLKDLKDWAISRNRYWGTPLPIWECQKCAKHIVINGLPELRERTKSTNRYFLIRHGEAQHNVDHLIASGPEKGKSISMITEKGEAQILDFVADMKKEKVQLIFTSPYLRTKKTALAIAKATKAKLIVDKRLVEINCGTFNWRSEHEYHGYFANKLDRFFKAPPGGETLTDVRVRMIRFIRDIDSKYRNKRIAIVSHGDCLWLLDSALKGLSNEETLASGYYPDHENHHEVSVSKLPYNKKGELDLHRPFVDDIEIPCDFCKGTAKRVRDVADVWFDSGGMPFASVHFPFTQMSADFDAEKRELGKLNEERLTTAFRGLDFPADYISEAIDQTRGWFYTLLAISTLLDRGIPYKNVICLGLIHDKHGVKMSKSKGNTVSPWDMMNKYGVDAIRWYFYTMNDPGDQKNFNEDDLAKTTRRFILILYNSFIFWRTYGHASDKPSAQEEMISPKHVLDRWILAKLNGLIKNVAQKLDNYAIGEAGRLVEEFADDLSRWYIRRSRDRFQNQAKGVTGSLQDWEDASRTLRSALLTLSKIIAPFMPFFAEWLYKSVEGKMESVHLENWPIVQNHLFDTELLTDIEELRRVIATALALRADNKLKVRQPLSSLTIQNIKLRDQDELLELLKDEINVKEVKFNQKLADTKGMVLDTVITPQLREEGI
ncbi:MAG: class I tRNA ligase family protein, partial [bacterium]|nr:class I tRNA ligase family protein [bacterium]